MQEDAVDGLIDDMRKEINKSEARKKDDERRELEAQQQRDEQLEKNKKLGKVLGKSVPTFYSNDAEGREIFVQTLSAFPSIVPKVGKTVLREEHKPRVPNPAALNRTQQLPRSNRPSLVSRAPEQEAVRTESAQKNEPLGSYSPPTRGVYETFSPNVGVTFSENGRNPKANNVSLSRHFAKISRAEFNTLKTETLEYNLTSNSHIMPDPALSKTLASRHSGCTGSQSLFSSQQLQTHDPTPAPLIIPAFKRVFSRAIRADGPSGHALRECGREWGHQPGRSVREDVEQLLPADQRVHLYHANVLHSSSLSQILQAVHSGRPEQP